MAPRVTEILLLRHGHRMAWTVDPATGEYRSAHPFPTGLPADPPLAAHGAAQANEAAAWLVADDGGGLARLARRRRLRIYSSPWYRCLETLRPTVRRLEDATAPVPMTVRPDRGVGEWFGKAWFTQPKPADPARLRRDFFPFVDDQGARPDSAAALPHPRGESIAELHDRVAKALALIVQEVEGEQDEEAAAAAAPGSGDGITVLICGHAAQIVASGRALTGAMPDDPDVEDFRCYTAGISRFVRRAPAEDESGPAADHAGWRGRGVAGGWDCVLNSWCGHLSGGEERGWHFHGDESFDSYAPLEQAGDDDDAAGVREDAGSGAGTGDIDPSGNRKALL